MYHKHLNDLSGGLTDWWCISDADGKTCTHPFPNQLWLITFCCYSDKPYWMKNGISFSSQKNKRSKRKPQSARSETNASVENSSKRSLRTAPWTDTVDDPLSESVLRDSWVTGGRLVAIYSWEALKGHNGPTRSNSPFSGVDSLPRQLIDSTHGSTRSFSSFSSFSYINQFAFEDLLKTAMMGSSPVTGHSYQYTFHHTPARPLAKIFVLRPSQNAIYSAGPNCPAWQRGRVGATVKLDMSSFELITYRPNLAPAPFRMFSWIPITYPVMLLSATRPRTHSGKYVVVLVALDPMMH